MVKRKLRRELIQDATDLIEHAGGCLIHPKYLDDDVVAQASVSEAYVQACLEFQSHLDDLRYTLTFATEDEGARDVIQRITDFDAAASSYLHSREEYRIAAVFLQKAIRKLAHSLA